MSRVAKLFALLAFAWSGLAVGQASVGGNSYIPIIQTNVTSPANNQCLLYQSSSQKWVNGSCASGGGAPAVSTIAVGASITLTNPTTVNQTEYVTGAAGSVLTT